MARIAVLVAVAGLAVMASTSIAATPPQIPGTIAFESSLGPEPDLIVSTADGKKRRFASTDAAGESAPAWSPDGTQIAFTSDRSGIWHLFVAGASGKAVPIGRAGAASEVDPSWSPDGATIAFATTDVRGRSRISVATVGTHGTAHDLTNGSADDADPVWSPQGDRIAFDRVVDGRSDLWTVDLRGRATPLTQGSPLDEENPSWSPDGKRIAFDAADAKGNIDVYVLDLGTGEERRLTTEPGLDFQPAWSPDGAQIAFTSDRSRNWEIWVMGADGSKPRDLSNSPKTTDDSAAWRPGTTTRGIRQPAARVTQAAFICDLPIGHGPGASSVNPLVGDAGPNKLCGDSTPSTISGAGGGDRLDGGAGNDRLNGNAGNDTIYACAGVSPDADTINGGTGSDTAWVLKAGVNRDSWTYVEYPRSC